MTTMTPCDGRLRRALLQLRGLPSLPAWLLPLHRRLPPSPCIADLATPIAAYSTPSRLLRGCKGRAGICGCVLSWVTPVICMLLPAMPWPAARPWPMLAPASCSSSLTGLLPRLLVRMRLPGLAGLLSVSAGSGLGTTSWVRCSMTSRARVVWSAVTLLVIATPWSLLQFYGRWFGLLSHAPIAVCALPLIRCSRLMLPRRFGASVAMFSLHACVRPCCSLPGRSPMCALFMSMRTTATPSTSWRTALPSAQPGVLSPLCLMRWPACWSAVIVLLGSGFIAFLRTSGVHIPLSRTDHLSFMRCVRVSCRTV